MTPERSKPQIFQEFGAKAPGLKAGCWSLVAQLPMMLTLVPDPRITRLLTRAWTTSGLTLSYIEVFTDGLHEWITAGQIAGFGSALPTLVDTSFSFSCRTKPNEP